MFIKDIFLGIWRELDFLVGAVESFGALWYDYFWSSFGVDPSNFRITFNLPNKNSSLKLIVKWKHGFNLGSRIPMLKPNLHVFSIIDAKLD